MAGGRFAKQADYRGGQLWNSNNANDTVIGGALSVSPANSNLGSQAWQTQPGDRIIFSPMDAVAFQNASVGNLYTGTYRYVNSANSVGSPARGLAAFWVPIAFNNNQAEQDALYQTTPDELNSYSVSLFAGVYLNAMGKSSYWWIQESGKANALFRGTLSGTGAIGQSVFLAAAGNNNADAARFDVLDGANSAAIFTANSNTAYTTVANMIRNFVGVAEQVPSNNNVSVVDLIFRNGGFRW